MPPDRLVLLTPQWAAPPGVAACMSTREGGVSRGSYASLNLGDHVGDDPAAVAENRRRYAGSIGATPLWMQQVHGAHVVDASGPRRSAAPRGDGVWTTTPGLACTVLVADCLPVLLATRNGRAVGAAHAGWRGLAAGVLEATVQAVCKAAACPASEVLAWLGPCIGPERFEVGADVLQAFGPGSAHRFEASAACGGRERWMADLAGLALDRLQRAGVGMVRVEGACTGHEPSGFFSFRRDGTTGRMAASVWLGA